MNELIDLDRKLYELTTRIMSEYNSKLDSILKESVLNNAHPPIKGDITKGKLRWRGIIRCIDHNGDTWIEQRGVKISPVIKSLNTVINDNNCHWRKEVQR